MDYMSRECCMSRRQPTNLSAGLWTHHISDASNRRFDKKDMVYEIPHRHPGYPRKGCQDRRKSRKYRPSSSTALMEALLEEGLDYSTIEAIKAIFLDVSECSDESAISIELITAGIDFITIEKLRNVFSLFEHHDNCRVMQRMPGCVKFLVLLKDLFNEVFSSHRKQPFAGLDIMTLSTLKDMFTSASLPSSGAAKFVAAHSTATKFVDPSGSSWSCARVVVPDCTPASLVPVIPDSTPAKFVDPSGSSWTCSRVVVPDSIPGCLVPESTPAKCVFPPAPAAPAPAPAVCPTCPVCPSCPSYPPYIPSAPPSRVPPTPASSPSSWTPPVFKPRAGGSPSTWTPANIVKRTVKISSVFVKNSSANDLMSVKAVDKQGNTAWTPSPIKSNDSVERELYLSTSPMASSSMSVYIDTHGMDEVDGPMFIGSLYLFELADITRQVSARTISVPVRVKISRDIEIACVLKYDAVASEHYEENVHSLEITVKTPQNA